jgi:hypothetical protein
VKSANQLLRIWEIWIRNLKMYHKLKSKTNYCLHYTFFPALLFMLASYKCCLQFLLVLYHFLLLYKISHHLFVWDNGWLITNYCLHSMKDIIKFSFYILLIYPRSEEDEWSFFTFYFYCTKSEKSWEKQIKNLSRVRKYFQNYTDSSRVVVKIWKFYSIKNMVCSMNW